MSWALILYLMIKVSTYSHEWEKLIDSEVYICPSQFHRIILGDVNSEWDLQIKLMTVMMISVVQILTALG